MAHGLISQCFLNCNKINSPAYIKAKYRNFALILIYEMANLHPISALFRPALSISGTNRGNENRRQDSKWDS